MLRKIVMDTLGQNNFYKQKRKCGAIVSIQASKFLVGVHSVSSF